MDATTNDTDELGTEGGARREPWEEATPATRPVLEELEIDRIEKSPTNPRKSFDEKGLSELAEDIKRRGVLSPVLVRGIDAGKLAHKRYELVFGERRWRAAKLAGLATIPAMVRNLSNQEVLEIQIVENLQRADIHPLEEADGYRMLHEKHGVSVEDIAAKVGKSTTYVYARLKLCTLIVEARSSFLEGKLSTGAALVLARIPHDDTQRRAFEKLLEWVDDEETASASQATDVVRRYFMLQLVSAPFSREDETLVIAAGSCVKCPKRTGAQRELFADIEAKDDLCTDEKCFTEKRMAAEARKIAEAERKGDKILDGDSAKSLFRNGRLVNGTGRVDLDEKIWIGDEPTTYRALLGDKAPKATLARDDQGVLHELVPRAIAEKAEEEAEAAARAKSGDEAPLGPPTPSKGALKEQEQKWKKEQADREAARAKEQAEQLALVGPIVGAVVAAAEAKGPNDAAMRVLLESMHDQATLDDISILARRGIVRPKGAFVPMHKVPAIAALKGNKLFALLLECAISEAYDNPSSDGDHLTAACKAYGLNCKGLRATAMAAFEKAKAATKKPAPKGKAKPLAKTKPPAKPAAKKAAKKK
jgi:ParB/RepB/Spo0J family partition protein